MDFEALRTFIRVAEAKTLSRAARLHRLPKSSLSHKIRSLEAELSVELFIRDGSELVLTDAGIEFLSHARSLCSGMEDAKTAVMELRREVRGVLTIASTGEFGTSLTGELMFEFRRRYPQIGIDLILLSPGFLFAPERHQAFDAIIFWGQPPDLDYLGRQLTTASYGLYAHDSYLQKFGTPNEPDDLHQHHALLFRKPTGLQSWFLTRESQTADILPPSQFISTDYWMLKYLAVFGEGIAYLPDFFAAAECITGNLQAILPEWKSPAVPINLLYPRRRYQSQRFRTFLDFCIAFAAAGLKNRKPRYHVIRDVEE